MVWLSTNHHSILGHNSNLPKNEMPMIEYLQHRSKASYADNPKISTINAAREMPGLRLRLAKEVAGSEQ